MFDNVFPSVVLYISITIRVKGVKENVLITHRTGGMDSCEVV